MDSITLLLKVLWAPREAMRLVSRKPRIVAPLVFAGVVSVVATTVIFLRLEPPGNMWVAMLLSMLLQVVLIIVVSALYFGVFTPLGRAANFKTFLAVTAFAFVPIIFRTVASIVTVMRLPRFSVVPNEVGTIGLAMFLTPNVSPVVSALAGFADVITIWVLVLLITGYQFLLRENVSMRVRALGVLSLWLVYDGLRLGLAVWAGL